MKRLGDIFIAVFGLILTLPIQLICICLILIADLQNPFFVQNRLGQFKKNFRIVKLRTMKNGQITSVGSVLRKTGLDELPQLTHILFGKMSVVGPRPITMRDAERLGWNDEFHKIRWNLKPGLTGLAQLSPICHKKMSWFLDKKYIACQSFFLDLKILVSSLAVVFVGKKMAVNWLNYKRNERTS